MCKTCWPCCIKPWDIQTHKNLEEKGILVPGKNLPLIDRKTVVVDAHPLLKSYMRDLERREKEIKRPQKGEKGLDNALKIMGDGMKASVDLRFIHPDIPATDSKLEALCSRCLRAVCQAQRRAADSSGVL
jgi:hypothetical protein